MSNVKIENNWIIYQGKKCGRIDNRAYVSERTPRDHFYVMGGGYPIADDILNWLKKHDIKLIKIVEKRKSGTKIWYATVEQYLKEELMQHKPYELQRCVPLNQFYTLQR